MVKKIGDILVDNKLCGLYNSDKRHKSYNGEPETFWVNLEDDQENIIEDKLIPFDYSMKRRIWSISIDESQTYKIKYGDYHFRTSVNVKMSCNKKLIYEFTTSDVMYAMIEAQKYMIIIKEHPFNFFNREEEEGRKIYYHGLPAFVKNSRIGEICIIPDTTDYTVDEWYNEYKKRYPYADDERIIEYKEIGYINHGDILSDGNIIWFRNESDI